MPIRTPIRRGGRALALGLAAGIALVATSVHAAPLERGKPGGPALSIDSASAYEGAGVISFPVRLDRPATSALRVNAVPLPGTARPAKDFRPGAVSTLIPAGATEGRLELAIYDNAEIGPDVTFTLRIASAPGAVVAQGRATGTIRDDEPLTVTLLHINDHHSNPQPVNNALNLGTSGGPFTVPFGGFPRVTAKIKEIETQLDNVVKVHAGDAITGTLYYTLFKGEADADLMNTACFDVFALGNHEFDDSDGTLVEFLDFLGADPDCATTVISANLVPKVGTPLAPTSPTDYVWPYAVKEFQGQKVAFIGITVPRQDAELLAALGDHAVPR